MYLESLVLGNEFSFKATFRTRVLNWDSVRIKFKLTSYLERNSYSELEQMPVEHLTQNKSYTEALMEIIFGNEVLSNMEHTEMNKKS